MVMEHLKDLLLNVFFIFILFFIYYAFIRERIQQGSNYWLLFITAGILIILCMTFPINLSPGYIKDLRHVPFIIGALYGGRKVAFPLFLLLISYSFYLHKDGLVEAIIVNVLLFITLWFVIPWFNRNDELKRRVKASVLVSSVAILYMIIIYYVEFSLDLAIPSIEILTLITLLFVIQCLTISLFVYFIEKYRYGLFMTEELKRLEKINTVSEIAASISHEVRNPLTITRGFIQLLRDERVTKEKRGHYIDLSLEELDRASSIISDYLTFAKPSLEHIQLLNLKNELNYVLNLVNPYALINNVELQLISEEEELMANGEAQRLHQCLINLIKNSIEAMPDSGQIIIELRKAESAEEAVILIKDTGIGMSAEQLSRLGTPYFTTKSTGTGLGMMVVYSIINAMDASFKVESEVGKGTCFTICLPLERAAHD